MRIGNDSLNFSVNYFFKNTEYCFFPECAVHGVFPTYVGVFIALHLFDVIYATMFLLAFYLPSDRKVLKEELFRRMCTFLYDT